MNSMTGFGRGEATNGNATVVVEMKSVNNRFLDLQVRVPREYLALEPRIHTALKDAIQRGRLEIFVRRQGKDSGKSVGVDAALAEKVHEAIVKVAGRLNKKIEDIPLEIVLGQPGVLFAIEQEPDATEEWDLVETALLAARSDLLTMRALEGASLQRDLEGHLVEMLRLRAEIEGVADGVVERLHRRLEERITRLIGDRVDRGRLAQEAAILADKADISEELSRIRSHCEQFADLLAAKEPVGRKLDFLLQELNREINTIGSKAAEHPIASRVVDMKSTLEKMREQAANVE
jgi:uncharacterized protein (TIGR00255 family)